METIQLTGVFDRMNVGNNQATGMWWGTGSAKTRLTGNSGMNAYDPKIITVHYDGSVPRIAYYTNGANYRQTTNMVSSFVSDTSASFSLGNKFYYGELLVYRDALSDDDREFVEGYLAQKWGMTGYLPAGHAGLDTSGWALGRGSSSNGVSSILSGVGGADSGSSSTISPSSDNQWHHVVSAYDGGTRKLYLDGEEVSSVTSSGSITANAHALIFGGTDMNSSAAATDEIKTPAVTNHSGIKLDEVRFYNTGLSAAQVTALYNYGKGDLARIGGFSSIPSVITATAGTALSTTVTADFINPLYSAYNLPNGLSINSSTGEISGTPTVGGNHEITIQVSGGSNEAPKKAFSTITYSAPSTAPIFGTPGAQNVVGDSALILAEIEQSGSNSNTVDFFWGTTDEENNTFATGMVIKHLSAQARKDFTASS